MQTPITSGILKSKFKAMAEPMTSAKSQAQIASSQIIQSANETGCE